MIMQIKMNLPQGVQAPVEVAASQPDEKNRYRNILPYDEFRVKLKTSSESASDYINASYVDGYKKENYYIASQGPLKSTIADFWKMVWEQSVQTIVMVTNLVELGNSSCYQYWPRELDSEVSYGNLSVRMVSQDVLPDMTIRKFRVEPVDELRDQMFKSDDSADYENVDTTLNRSEKRKHPELLRQRSNDSQRGSLNSKRGSGTQHPDRLSTQSDIKRSSREYRNSLGSDKPSGAVFDRKSSDASSRASDTSATRDSDTLQSRQSDGHRTVVYVDSAGVPVEPVVSDGQAGPRSRGDVPSLEVVQYHYTAWPDRSIPRHASSIINFRNSVSARSRVTPGPVLVHCSAGIGRTGTYIAIDVALEQAEHVGTVDVYNTVLAMRKRRVNMIQTLDQYIFTHDALLEVLYCGNTSYDCNEYTRRLTELLTPDPHTNITPLQKQYDVLELLKPNYAPKYFAAALRPTNIKKNRDKNILAIEPKRVFISPREHSSDYVNAIYVDVQSFIVTQIPLDETVIDYWSLVVDSNCDIIITLSKDPSSQIPVYIPSKESKSLKCGPFTVEQTNFYEQNLLQIQDLEIQIKKQENVHRIRHIQLAEDSDELQDVFTSLRKTAFALFEELQTWRRRQQSVGRPFIVSCLDGCLRSGLLSAFFVISNMIQHEKKVDVFSACQRIRWCRPEFIVSLEQYEFLHQITKEYLLQYETYANFQ